MVMDVIYVTDGKQQIYTCSYIVYLLLVFNIINYDLAFSVNALMRFFLYLPGLCVLVLFTGFLLNLRIKI